MAKLSIKEVEKIATLAKLGLSDKEKAKLAVDLSEILDFVETIQKTDTKNVETTSQVTDLIDVLREDVVKDCDIPREKLLKIAPETENGFVKVRRVLE